MTLALSRPWLLAGLAGIGLAAQPAPASRPASELLTRLPQLTAIATAAAGTELTIRWTAASVPLSAGGSREALASPQANQLTVSARRPVNAAPARERDPQLSVDQLVVVAINAEGQEIGWQLVKDPRLIRAEFPVADGALSGQILSRPVAELVVEVPDDGVARALLVYECEWTGREFVLTALGSVTVTRP